MYKQDCAPHSDTIGGLLFILYLETSFNRISIFLERMCIRRILTDEISV